MQQTENQAAAPARAPASVGVSPYQQAALATVLVENAPLAMAMFDREMRYLIANQRWLSEFQLDQAEVLGRSHFEIFPNLHDSWREIYERCLQGYVERCEEDILEHPDGTRDWVRWELRPWRLADFSVGGLIISCEIVTPIKQAEQALRDDHDLADALLQGSSPVVILDATGHIVRHSRGAVHFADARSVIGGTLQGMPFPTAFPLEQEGGLDFTARLAKLARERPDLQAAGDRLLTCSRMADDTRLVIDWAISPNIDEQGILTQIVLTGIPRPLAPRHPATAPPTRDTRQQVDPSPAAGPTPGHLIEPAHPEPQGPQSHEPFHRAAAAQNPAPKDDDPSGSHDDTMRASLLAARHAPLGLVLLDPEATILYANDQVGRILGVPLLPGDDIEKWLRSGCPDEDYAREITFEWRDNIWRRQLKRIITLSTSEHLLKEIEFRPSLLEDGNLLVAIADVTETQRAEEALRASENRLRGMFDNTPVAIALVDPAGYIFDANPSMETLLGRSRLDLRRTRLDTIIAAGDLEKKYEVSEKMRREGLASASVELGLLHGSGEIIPARVHVAKATGNEDRLAFTSLLIVSHGREDALAAELLESQIQNRALLLASGKAVLLIDRESRTVLDMHLPEHFPASPELRGLEGSRLAVTHPEIDGLLARLLLDTPERGDWQRSCEVVLQRAVGAPLRLAMQLMPVDGQRGLLLLGNSEPERSSESAPARSF